MTNAESYVMAFWEKIDLGLKQKNITMTILASDLGLKRETIYTQKRRKQLPKAEHIVAMLNYLGIEDTSKKSPFAEYIPYLEQAEAWQIKAVRELLKMPPLEDYKKKNETCAV